MESNAYSASENLTPKEAEEVLRRFREEEEELQKRMEAIATNPTVADLAEGLGVPVERITRLLNEIRQQPAPLASVASKEVTQESIQSNHSTAWVVAAIVFGLMFLAIIIGVVLAPSAPIAPQAPASAPSTDAVAPSLE